MFLYIHSAPKCFSSSSLLNSFILFSFFSSISFSARSSSSFFFLSSSSKAFLSFLGSIFLTSFFCSFAAPFFFLSPASFAAFNFDSTSAFTLSSINLFSFPFIGSSFSICSTPSLNLIPISFSTSSYENGPYSLKAASYLITHVVYPLGSIVNTFGIIVRPLMHFGGVKNSQSNDLSSDLLNIVSLISLLSPSAIDSK